MRAARLRVQHRIHDTEHAGGEPQAQAQRQDGDGGEAGGFRERAPGGAKVGERGGLSRDGPVYLGLALGRARLSADGRQALSRRGDVANRAHLPAPLPRIVRAARASSSRTASRVPQAYLNSGPAPP